ncbi:mRNA surveillance protein pelota [Candidatus Woesearchaeota archaeon]|nr:MAG: mRNA surveillance protein pelota [Candidatus Woesearchaeota archaeon]
MKVIFKDFKSGVLKFQVESLDDLWYISHVIDKGDIVQGKTFRKIKIGQEPNVKVVKKPLFLKIQVEKVEFHKFTNSLRVSGKVVEGTEDVGKGSYHTFDLKEGSVLTLQKPKWLSFQVEKINEASKPVNFKILVCVLDRESATIALIKNYGFDVLTELQSDMKRKGDISKENKSSYYSNLAKIIKDYVERYNIKNIILASPAFWKDELFKQIQKTYPELTGLVTLATCNSASSSGISEVLKRDEVKNVISQDRVVKELNLVEELLKEISKDGKAVYGFKQVNELAQAGAIDKLLVLDELIHEYKNNDEYDKLDNLMKLVDSTQGKVVIISSENEAGKKLKSLGSIAALLRYKLY